MTTGPGVHLHPADATELTELLQFLDDWLSAGNDQLHPSLARFAGNPAYGIGQLRGDLHRFAFLLGAGNGKQLFGDG